MNIYTWAPSASKWGVLDSFSRHYSHTTGMPQIGMSLVAPDRLRGPNVLKIHIMVELFQQDHVGHGRKNPGI